MFFCNFSTLINIFITQGWNVKISTMVVWENLALILKKDRVPLWRSIFNQTRGLRFTECLNKPFFSKRSRNIARGRCFVTVTKTGKHFRSTMLPLIPPHPPTHNVHKRSNSKHYDILTLRCQPFKMASLHHGPPQWLTRGIKLIVKFKAT